MDGEVFKLKDMGEECQRGRVINFGNLNEVIRIHMPSVPFKGCA